MIIAKITLFLIFSFQEGTDVDATARGKDVKYKQPFLLSLGPSRQPVQYCLILDQLVVSCGTKLVEAMDKLFKAHYVYDVQYSPILSEFWGFISAFVYGVTPAISVRPGVRAFATAIRATKLN